MAKKIPTLGAGNKILEKFFPARLSEDGLSAAIAAGVAAAGEPAVTLRGLPRANPAPVLTLTKTATPSGDITAPVVYPYTDAAFLFTGNGPGNIGIYGKNAVGGATAATFEWWSDAPLFEIRLNGSNLFGSLFVDGQLASGTTITTDGSGADYLLRVDFGGVAKPRRFKFWGVNLLFGGVRIPGAYTSWKPVQQHPFVWALTDSYGFGTGAAPLAENAFMVACHNLGIEGLADGIGGTGWIEGGGGTLPSPESRITSKLVPLTRAPDEVWFMLGLNNKNSDLEAVEAGVNASVAAVRGAWPNTIVRIFGPYTPAGMTANLQTITNLLRDRAQALGVFFEDMAGLVTAGNKALYTGVDDLHPTPEGHRYIGGRQSLIVKPRFGKTMPPPTENIGALPTSTTLAALPTTPVFGSPTTLTATVAPSHAPGVVEFKEGATVLETVTVTEGQAVWTTSTELSIGTHNLTAFFVPTDTAAYNTSLSGAASVTVSAVPLNYGISDWDHRYPLAALSLADGEAFTSWPDSGTNPDPLLSQGAGGGSIGTSLFESDEGGFVRLLSTAGNAKRATTTNVVTKPRTTVLIARGTTARQMAHVGGANLTRAGTTGFFQLTAAGSGAGGQIILSSVSSNNFVCIILCTDTTAASMYVNGVKTTSGTWVPGADTTLRIQTSEASPADFKFIGSVGRIISDAEAAAIYSAMQTVYPEIV